MGEVLTSSVVESNSGTVVAQTTHALETSEVKSTINERTYIIINEQIFLNHPLDW